MTKGDQGRDGVGHQWVGITANAGSGLGAGKRRVDRLVGELARRGLRARTAWTLAERADLVADSVRDPNCRCLVAAGGDGTVAALINERPSVPITVLPAGTENLFAGHFGLSRDPVRLAATIASGRRARIDLGVTGSRRFTLMAGIGFDADVVSRHHVTRIGRAGIARPTHRGAYVESVLRSSLQYRFPALSVTIADPGREETLVGTSVFLFNLPRYALGLPFAPAARGDDGWLDLVVFREAGPFQALHYLWMVVRGVHLHRPGVYHRRVRRAVVSAAEAVPVQLDGDPGGYVHGDGSRGWSVEVLPQAIDVLVPCA
ncbi:MAG: diacylglycerol kinase family protein [Isosphaeraceae bacterium]|nr:diacylglycerol kinase family protein [Isosphaeraceae bacterium]